MRVQAVAVNYNNALEIRPFLEALAAKWPIEDAVVVDDGSTDGSADIAEALGFQVLRHSANSGIGAAIRTGLHDAADRGSDAVVILSCNGKMDPNDLAAVTEPVRLGRADYVQGNRYRAGGSPMPFFRSWAAPLFSAVGSLFLRRWFADLTCGFRCYRLDLLKRPGVNVDQSWLDQYELEYYLHVKACRSGLRVVEAPVTIRYDHLAPSRRSKIRPFTGWWSMLRPFIYLSLSLRS